MYDLQELYQEIVLDHSRKPRNFGKLEDATGTGEGFNPLCGDQITLYLKIEDDTISDIGFEGVGCAISKASASMMTQGIKGKSTEETQRIFEEFRRMITNSTDGDYDAELLGDLEILSGVSKYPARIKCAVLSWHTLNAALSDSLNGGTEPVSTE